MIGLKKEPIKGRERKRMAFFYSFGEEEKTTRNLFPSVSENCDCRGGRLQGGIGLKKELDALGKELTVALGDAAPATQIFSVILNKDGLADNPAFYAMGINGFLYLRNGNAMLQKVFLGGNVEHFALKGEGKEIYNIFCGDQSVAATLDGDVFRNVFSEVNLGGCICGKRFLMLTSNGEIKYTAALAPFDLDEKNPNGRGRIYLPAAYGAPVGIKKFGDSAYIFFKKGICKLTLSATASEHSLQVIPYQGGTICLRAQVTAGDGIVFLACEGAYYLRNDRVERICEELPIAPCATNMVASVGRSDDVVMLSYYREGIDEVEGKRLVLYNDGKHGYFTSINGLLGGNEYVYSEGKIYRYQKACEGIAYPKMPFFTSEQIDFGLRGKKRLKRLTLKGKGKVRVVVQSAGGAHVYNLTFTNGVAVAKLFDKGETFTFTFYMEGGALLEGMEIAYTTEA